MTTDHINPDTGPRRAGGSATIAARGLKRGGGEVNPGAPDRFCVVGGTNPGDASEADLRARYEGNAWALAECCEEVRAAVDADPRLLATVGRWWTAAGELRKTPAEQRAWLAARTAPKPVRAAAPKRPTAKRVEAFADALLVHSGAKSAIFQAVGLLRGTIKIGDVTDSELRYAWQASEGARAGK